MYFSNISAGIVEEFRVMCGAGELKISSHPILSPVSYDPFLTCNPLARLSWVLPLSLLSIGLDNPVDPGVGHVLPLLALRDVQDASAGGGGRGGEPERGWLYSYLS